MGTVRDPTDRTRPTGKIRKELDGDRHSFAWTPVEQLGALKDAWNDLAANAANPNPYYSPGMLLSYCSTIGVASDVKFACVWNGSGPDRRLDAFAAFVRKDLRWGWPVRTWRNWSNKYFLKFEPLIRAGQATSARQALFHGLSDNGRLKTLLLSPGATWMPDSSQAPASAEIESAAKYPRKIVSHDQRAALFHGHDPDTYFNDCVSRKTRQTVKRRMRGLEDMGSLEFRTVRDPADVKRAVADFLHLEKASWKGAQGSAMASTAADEAFAQAAICGAHSQPQISCDVLSLDGRAIAVSVSLISANWLFGFKTAFDEDLGKHSPGAVLHYLATCSFLRDETLVAADSTCVPGHPIESMWSDRICFGTTLTSIGAPISDARLNYFAQAEAVRANAKSAAKSAYHSAFGKKVTATKR